MRVDLFDLREEVAVVIGGTGVLGGALAEGLAAAGARIAIVGRNAERGESRAKAIGESGGEARFFPGDATDEASLHRAHALITDQLGVATILVNAAGGNDARSHRYRRALFRSDCH